MGGVAVDEGHNTNIPGLYAAGECACQYHGANRLGGNSMLGAIYGGRLAAKSVMSVRLTEADDGKSGPIRFGILSRDMKNRRQVSVCVAKEIQDILLAGLGIVRDEDQIAHALVKTDNLLTYDEITVAEKNRILLGKAMLTSSLLRRESRGAHYRTDYPQRNDGLYRKTTIAKWNGSEIEVRFRNIPERRTAYGDNP
jgi:succinate dehydrogenase / fumarate reductase flavoprotein subunit